ncbi:RNA polymerase sigma factor [Solitalea canadensis]|uniref:RNA polymerase sigma-70 factor, Bacteroides expansion family 1 n=1 Tax=Solitalea canadensis (strain ATCC 29591 / DSM 3403 / JCM 21819 / LMG 8368 / NBRC 15130 / NCIMB 12057 / USAM 9D) TaxID=929556 RepID=H8KTD4_SOLCM|nr:RNA polymerase sigma-70 factor [Solitalea canadensis]AFD06271.1 RNA polymerase sigma-70 factor, Bacteroides expansion family 1 [Solitalea canadensis DSM 3403]
MDLISLVKAGELSAFKKVYAKFHEKLYFFVLKQTNSAYLAEEVVQLTFIKLWERREQLSDDYLLSVQVFRIARTVMIDELRKQTTIRKGMENILAEQKEEPVTPLAESITYKEALASIDKAIEYLPPKRREIFKLSRYEGYSHKKIAELLSISPKTVENQISQALKQLRENISDPLAIVLLIFIC